MKRAWPNQEAERLQNRLRDTTPRTVTFETGFGASGLPHIGTFSEVARTTWVRKTFEKMTGCPTELIVFSDDMDGLKKVPLNMPNAEMLEQHVGKPVCAIPDPYGELESFSAYMNRRLKEFLSTYGFDYRFQSAYDAYNSGQFDPGLRRLIERVEDVRNVILPTLREETRGNWSPFFPICEKCGRVNSTRVAGYHADEAGVDYVCDVPTGGVPGCGHAGSVSILGGKAKVGWKVDWALRWFTYGIDYEMYGKDLIESAKLSIKILRILGGRPPQGLVFELFLDEHGKKISKSLGQGLTVESWIKYAPVESLLYYIYQNPKRAKRLFWDVVPRSVDEYLAALAAFPDLDEPVKQESAVLHIFEDPKKIPGYGSAATYSLIENLIDGLGTADTGLIRDFLERYDPAAAEHREIIEDLIKRAAAYYQDVILPEKKYKKPDENEKLLLGELKRDLLACPVSDENELQAIPFSVAQRMGIEPPALFRSFYKILLGQERGPRFGTLVKLLGRDRLIGMIEKAVSNG